MISLCFSDGNVDDDLSAMVEATARGFDSSGESRDHSQVYSFECI